VLLIDQIERWLFFVLDWGACALMVWAFVDCATRKGPAFPAAGKLTKPAWLLMTGIPAALSLLLVLQGFYIVLNLLVYIGLIVCSVYLADVRPAVREISGPSRW
jgi:hypothetical protein